MNTRTKLLVGAVLCAAAMPVAGVNPGEPPLPSVDSVLHRVLERVEKESENDHQFNAQYIYSRTKQTETRNSQGELKKKDEQTREHNPTIERVAARPRPATPATSSRSTAGKTTAGTNEGTAPRGQAFEKTDFPLNDDLLKRYKFTLVGREMRNGRPTLVLDFVPASRNLPERTIKDRFINKAAGRAWVDEDDAAIVQADLRLTEKVSVAGGLVGALWKFNFKFNREHLPDGLWYTRDTDWHLEGREFFIRKIMDYHEERTEVRAAHSPGLPPVE
ncbi:MAG: hypothetical protein HY298_15205 [Verrucomicrobia bacterium]|nr:hypothetical protein [Verrucomicrobiota bacterium]